MISLPGVLLGVLIAIAGVVFFVLPNWVEEQGEQVPVVEGTQPDTPAVSEGPFFTPEELEDLRDQAESLLALLLSQQGELDGQSVSDWGGEDFGLYQALSREGDDAYLIDAFYDAVPAYSEVPGYLARPQQVSVVINSDEAWQEGIQYKFGIRVRIVRRGRIVMSCCSSAHRGLPPGRGSSAPGLFRFLHDGRAACRAGDLFRRQLRRWRLSHVHESRRRLPGAPCSRA